MSSSGKGQSTIRSEDAIDSSQRYAQEGGRTEAGRVMVEYELDQAASYNVHNDGFVVIKFAESVSLETYTRVVDMLRSNPDIRGVRAEQGGREVCKLKGYR